MAIRKKTALKRLNELKKVVTKVDPKNFDMRIIGARSQPCGCAMHHFLESSFVEKNKKLRHEDWLDLFDIDVVTNFVLFAGCAYSRPRGIPAKKAFLKRLQRAINEKKAA